MFPVNSFHPELPFSVTAVMFVQWCILRHAVTKTPDRLKKSF